MMRGGAIDPITLLPVETGEQEPTGPSAAADAAALEWMAAASGPAGQVFLQEIVGMLQFRINELIQADLQAKTLLEVARRIDQKTAVAANAIDSLIARTTRHWKAAGHGNTTSGPDGRGTAP